MGNEDDIFLRWHTFKGHTELANEHKPHIFLSSKNRGVNEVAQNGDSICSWNAEVIL